MRSGLIVLLVVLSVASRSAADQLALREAPSRMDRTPEEQAQVDVLLGLAQREGAEDTDLPQRVRAALDSRNPWVRSNAFAMMAATMLGLRTAPAGRGQVRRPALTEAFWPLALGGLDDVEASVRRYAIMALMSLDADAGRSTVRQKRVRQLFDIDPSGEVRARAFEVLSQVVVMPDLDMALVERAIADPSPSVKFAGFNILWLRRPPGYLAVMLAKLHDEQDADTRVAAAEALRNVVPIDGSVVDAVAARLARETDPQVRQRMASTLGQMKAFAASIRKPGP